MSSTFSSHGSRPTSAISTRWRATREIPQIILVTDPGPDPDDAKTLLILAILHKQGAVVLRAVIASGGGQPVRRARLAKCLLNHLRVFDVPVGVGSAGIVSQAQPHEFGIRDYELVSIDDLVPGHELLMRTLREAKPLSLVVVCVASLRDVADMVLADEELFLRKVARVAIQGELQRTAVGSDHSASMWEPDTSVNNCFDMEAASLVYRFCFERRLPMTVTSRVTVPLLPMQLARSFAEPRHNSVARCPVMAYLADCQQLGLVGLWAKLCAKELPARCDKQWYFATFCGIDKSAFVAANYEELGDETDIATYLNGFVKPYDVVALMTVLPLTRELFGKGAVHAVNGMEHLLLLEPEHTLPVSFVVNLLRDVYVAVVATTCPPAGDGSISSRRQVASLSMSTSRIVAAFQAERRRSVSLSQRGSCSSNPSRRSTIEGWKEEDLVAFVGRALDQVARRQTQISRVAAVVAFTFLALVVVAVAAEKFLLGSLVIFEHAQRDDDTCSRLALYTVVGSMAGFVSLLALHPVATQICRLRTSAVIFLAVISTLTLLQCMSAVAFYRGQHELGYPPSLTTRVVMPICLVFSGLTVLLLLLITVLPARLYRTICRMLWLTIAFYFSGLSIAYGVHFVLRVSTRAELEDPRNSRWTYVCSTLFTALVTGTFATLGFLPHFRSRAQGWLALRLGGAPASSVGITPLFGFGTSDVDHRLEIAQAYAAFSPVEASEHFLADELEACLLRGLAGRLSQTGPKPRGSWSARIPRRCVSMTSSQVHPVLPPRPCAETALEDRSAVPIADFYVCHSHLDSAHAKCLALRKFLNEISRGPGHTSSLWLDGACVDRASTVEQAIAGILSNMSRCKKLVVLWGPTLVSRTWCVLEILCWRALRPSISDLIIVPVVSSPRDFIEIVASVDTFHVLHCELLPVLESERITLALDVFTSAHANAVIRGLLHEVHVALGAAARNVPLGAEGTAGEGGGIGSAGPLSAAAAASRLMPRRASASRGL